ncbi:hypothetical protein ACFLYQ_00380 [Chloroflexota bacterium]
MPEKKYEKHFIHRPLIDSDFVKHRIVCQGSKYDFGGIFENYWLRWNCITEAHVMSEPHAHDFDEIFHFYGADASDISDFQAIVEVSMGEEEEIYTITEPTIVFVPAGMVHAPINFKEITKPIIFMNVANAPDYTTIQ